MAIQTDKKIQEAKQLVAIEINQMNSTLHGVNQLNENNNNPLILDCQPGFYKKNTQITNEFDTKNNYNNM